MIQTPSSGRLIPPKVFPDLASGKPLANWMPPGLTANFPMNLHESGHAVIAVFRNPAKLAMFDMTTGAMIAYADTCGDTDDVFSMKSGGASMSAAARASSMYSSASPPRLCV
jgi:hypothetical protein